MTDDAPSSAATAINAISEDVISLAIAGRARIITAESCTGGMISAALTGIAGASQAVDGGFVTYSNEAKRTALHVEADLLDDHGAVSTEVARAMAAGALAAAKGRATHAISVTGIAGPGGGSQEKPVGLVCFGLATATMTARAYQQIFDNRSRNFIRIQSVLYALALLKQVLEKEVPEEI